MKYNYTLFALMMMVSCSPTDELQDFDLTDAVPISGIETVINGGMETRAPKLDDYVGRGNLSAEALTSDDAAATIYGSGVAVTTQHPQPELAVMLKLKQ